MKLALYIHVPFCLRRCSYCDFITYADRPALKAPYAAALLRELHLWAAHYPEAEAITLYFGGGTPSLLPAEAICALVEAARRSFRLRANAEITLEANPGAVDAAKLAALRRGGVNRLSLGVQSANAQELRLLGRIHTWEQAVHTVAEARAAGFDNLSLDLIFGLPQQTLADWQCTMEAALALAPEHLSLYALTLEPGTPLADAVARGDLPEPDADLAADIYEWTSERLLQAGFWQYEISNWARGRQPASAVWSLPPEGSTENIGPWIARHNLVYWRNAAWLGLGVAAHSALEGRRWSNLTDPATYIAAVERGAMPLAEAETLSRPVDMGETMMLGLRLAEGVTEARFRERFGVSLVEVYGDVLTQLAEAGLLMWDQTRVRLTQRGRLLGNRVFAEFLFTPSPQPRYPPAESCATTTASPAS